MENDKATEILKVARQLIMARGYNGFSFRDVAAEVGIKSASIHYHFPTKADLVQAVAKDYREWCSSVLADLTAPDAPSLLRAYGDLFVDMFKGQAGVCLGGVLAVDAANLPSQITAEVECFFKSHHVWLAEVLRKGQEKGEIKPDIDPDAFAAMIVSSIEGAMMIARGIGKLEHLSDTINQLIELVKT